MKLKMKTPKTASRYKPFEDGTKVISTGSTLLDLAISGNRVRGGGIPGGVMCEVFGPSASGKTAVIVEVGASAQSRGGEVVICDPEARLDAEYVRLYGMELNKEKYFRPNTVGDVLNSTGKVVEKGLTSIIKEWEPENVDAVNVLAADSIAALSTSMEMDTGDKRGQRKAKELSEMTRVTARLISQNNKLVIFTNQERQTEYGFTTPGGFAIGYHCSLRIRIAQKGKIEKKKKVNLKTVTKAIGIESEAIVKKSSVDDPYRTAPIYLIFGVGIDDVRANLQWYKDMTGANKYECGDGKEYVAMDDAIRYVEDNDLEEDLRNRVIDLWEDIEDKFALERKRKKRF